MPANPLYNAFKAKSFTGGDIVFHFYIFDLLYGGRELSIREIADEVAAKYLSQFDDAEPLDESTIRKKLKEYEALGHLTSCRRGRELVFKRAESAVDLHARQEALAFYAEENPLGVVRCTMTGRMGRSC